jgi:hypothetical protein
MRCYSRASANGVSLEICVPCSLALAKVMRQMTPSVFRHPNPG